ncbi:MAG: hypothetical protein RJA49_2084 [Actinomycetota bacterium]|jgi:uncharacterized protein
MANPLLVNAAELLRRAGMQKSVALQVALVDLEIVDDPRFEPDAEVDVRLDLESLNDGIMVDGTVSVPWHGTCRRCVEPTGGVSVSEVHELYQRVVTGPDAFEIVGDQLDLRAIARELVLLDTPATPLCRPDCAGLCPTCGANLNDGPCSCTPPPADPRWSGLDQLDVADIPLGED